MTGAAEDGERRAIACSDRDVRSHGEEPSEGSLQFGPCDVPEAEEAPSGSTVAVMRKQMGGSKMFDSTELTSCVESKSGSVMHWIVVPPSTSMLGV